MNNTQNKTGVKLRYKNTHQACKTGWNEERRLQNNPHSLIKKNRTFYQHTKSKSATSRTKELLKERQKIQKYQLNKTMGDIEDISFGGKARVDKSKFTKTVAFNELLFDQQRQMKLEELARQQQEARQIGNMRKYKYYFLQNLQQGHPKYSPYKMFDRTINPIHRPYLRTTYYDDIELDHRYKSPHSLHSKFINSSRLSPTMSPAVRFNYGVSSYSPIKSSEIYNKSMNQTSDTPLKYPLSKRTHTQSSSNNYHQKLLPSKQDLKSIFVNHQEDIIQFLINLVKKQ